MLVTTVNKKEKQTSEQEDQNYHHNLKEQRQQQPTHGSNFFQLVGHKDSFKTGIRAQTILKRATGNEESCLKKLMRDKLAPYVAKFFGVVKLEDGYHYLELQDLTSTFQPPDSAYSTMNDICAMDIKMGCITCREDEGLCVKTGLHKMRPDMYLRMVEIDPKEPTEDENQTKCVSKERYMVWRDNITSSASLGFRIEAMRFKDGKIEKSFQTTKSEEQIITAFKRYATSNCVRVKYLTRLYELRKTLLQSEFFHKHELIGSSLLFLHKGDEANIWIIDFAKTNKVPDNVQLTHRHKRCYGNYEDGYLIGIDNLIRIFESITEEYLLDNSILSSSRELSFLKDDPYCMYRTKV